MRSLALKLTLAFLLIGIFGITLFAVLVSARARDDFRTYLSDRDRDVLIDSLAAVHAERGGWVGIEDAVRARPQLDGYVRGVALADANNVVILPTRYLSVGAMLNDEALSRSEPIVVNGRVVGRAVFPRSLPADAAAITPAAERALWRRVTISTLISGVTTLTLSALVGWLLARTLTRNVSALTDATRAMAGGKLGHTVAVSSRDEIGELARSFNLMSVDLEKSSQARKQMTADLAHDLRTPLTVLRGYTEGLKDGRIAVTTQIYEVMHEEVAHLQRMVEDLRTLSLADAGELVLNRREIDPRALIERALLAHVLRAEQNGLTLRIAAEPGDGAAAHRPLPSINVDTDRMAQVFDNLVSNAIAHTRQGGIVLRAERSADQRVRLSIADTGAGISSADLPRIFERFYRADAARQRSDDDTSSGLGLAIVRAITEAHGGEISVTSALGAGTTFSIVLPVSRA